MFINKIRAKRHARRDAARLAAVTVAGDQSSAYRTALEDVLAVTQGVKVPNGTTKKIARIAAEALA